MFVLFFMILFMLFISRILFIPVKIKINRIQQQIQSDLSPKYTEMKTGARISRFGRPQTETKQDASSIPTEIAKFIPKHSPKRLKVKEVESEIDLQQNGCVEEEHQKFPPNEKNKPEEEIFHDKEGIIPEVTKIEASLVSPEIDENNSNDLVELSINAAEKQENISNEKEQIVEASTLTEKIQQDENDNNEVMHVSVKEPLENHPDDVSDTSSVEKSKQDFSDTDSALGSTASCSENKDEEFFVGQILWGSFSTLSWYPCMAYPYDTEGNITKQGLCA